MSSYAKFVIAIASLGIFHTVPVALRAAIVTEMTSCKKSPFTGSWVSTKASVAFLSKIEIKETCKQITTKPVATNNPWAGVLGEEKKYIYREFIVRPISTCSPVDCVWGRSKGVFTKKDVLNARFVLFLSKRYLQITQINHTLRVRWRIKYNGGRKPDQLGETSFIRAN